jgi:hypothetical protein
MRNLLYFEFLAPRRLSVQCPFSTPNGSVSLDWRLPLRDDKSDAYLTSIRRLETSYAMFSVSLDEAFGMRRGGHHSKAYQVLAVSPALCQRLAHPLLSVLQSMLEHAKHFGTTPNLVSLAAENFQYPRSQRVARFNDLFSKILLTRRSQFLHKISALADLVEELNDSFGATVEELASGESLEPERDWETLDAVHYDLNTCLREAVVLLKSFLHALPEAQLASFQAVLEAQSASSASIAARARHLAHRRMAFLKGQ